MTTATPTSKGQITIPVEVRKALGVDAGDRVEFVCLIVRSAAAAGCEKTMTSTRTRRRAAE